MIGPDRTRHEIVQTVNLRIAYWAVMVGLPLDAAVRATATELGVEPYKIEALRTPASLIGARR